MEKFIMSKVSSAHKVENMDKQLLQQLQDILNFCEEKGHQPEIDSEQSTTLENIKHLIYIRGRKGISVPDNILSLLAKIKNYPTAVKQKRKDLAFQKATENAERKLTFKQKYEQIQSLIPFDLKLFEFVYGKENFKQFINTDMDTIVTKAVLEYFYKLFNRAAYVRSRTVYAVKLYTATYDANYPEDVFENESHWKTEQNTERYISDDFYILAQKTTKTKDEQRLLLKYEKHEPFSIDEIGTFFHLSGGRIGMILGDLRKKTLKSYRSLLNLNDNKLENILQLYRQGKTQEIMAILSYAIADEFRGKPSVKLEQIPTKLLDRTGKTVLEFFNKSKSINH